MRKTGYVFLILLWLGAGFVPRAVADSSDGQARVIPGIMYADRVEFEKEMNKKWEDATDEERSRFLSEKQGETEGPANTSKAPTYPKSIFDKEKKSDTPKNLKKPHPRPMGY